MFLLEKMKIADSAAQYEFIAGKWLEIGEYKNATELAQQCREQAKIMRNKREKDEEKFFKALSALNGAKIQIDLEEKAKLAQKATELFKAIENNKTVEVLGKQAQEIFTETGKKLSEMHVNQQKYAEEQRIASQRRLAGQCQHCGGEMKGLFAKKCANCGRTKDY